MPLIQLPGLDPVLDFALVRSIQLWPGDEQRRNHYLARRCAQEALRMTPPHRAAVQLPRRVVEELLEGPDWEQLEAEAKATTKDAVLAGCMLLFFYIEDTFGEKLRENAAYRKRGEGGASLARARFAAAAMAAEETPWPDGAPIHKSDRHLKEVWRKYRPVAHLWAAYVWNRDAVRFADFSPSLLPGSLRNFLSVAGHLQKYGESRLLPDKGKNPTPLLEPAEIWDVDVVRHPPKPPPLPPGNGSAITPRGWLAASLARYKAQK